MGLALYFLGLGAFFALLGAFMRWSNGSGPVSPGVQDLTGGLKLWPLFWYGGLALIPVGVVVGLVEAVG